MSELEILVDGSILSPWKYAHVRFCFGLSAGARLVFFYFRVVNTFVHLVKRTIQIITFGLSCIHILIRRGVHSFAILDLLHNFLVVETDVADCGLVFILS